MLILSNNDFDFFLPLEEFSFEVETLASARLYFSSKSSSYGESNSSEDKSTFLKTFLPDLDLDSVNLRNLLVFDSFSSSTDSLSKSLSSDFLYLFLK